MKNHPLLICFGCLTLGLSPAICGEVNLRLEDFENGASGSSVASLTGWSGDANIKVADTLIASGRSINWMGGASPVWPSVRRPFSGTPSVGDVYVLTGTLFAPDTTGSCASLGIRNSTDPGQVVKAVLGYNSLYFYVLGTASGGFSLTLPQSLVPMDVKMVISATKAEFYYRDHGVSAWNFGGNIPYGNVLSAYDEIIISGHGNYPGGIDAVRLSSSGYMDESFERGVSGQPAVLLNGWTGDTNVRISSSTIDQGLSANWMGGASPAWPSIYKEFTNVPAGGDVYTLTATLSAPNTTGAYARLSLQNSANRSQCVQAVLGYNSLYFYILGTPAGGFSVTNPQLTVPVDIKMVVSPTSASFYYKDHRSSAWNSGGTIPYGNPLSVYNEINVVGHGNYGGGIDSIQLSTSGEPVSRGRQVILNRGLQIQSLVFFNSPGFSNISQWLNTRFSTLNFWGSSNPTLLGLVPAGTQWSRMYLPADPASKMLRSTEIAYAGSFASMQYGDELGDTLQVDRQLDMYETFRTWNQSYPNTMAYTNFGGYASWAPPNTLVDLVSYMRATQPDMMCFDAYPPFAFPEVGEFPYFGRNNWYTYMQMYRTAALQGYDGTGMRPIPYGQYLNLFRDDHNETLSLPSEAFVRLQQFASWTFGFTYVSAFIYNSVSSTSYLRSVIFSGPGDTSPTPVLAYVATANTQSRNLAPALVRLKSTDVRMIKGTNFTTLPSGLSAWASGAGGCDYITGITPRGKTNVASPSAHSDWLIGYFQPLKIDNSDYPYANGLHFMITNGAAGVPTLPGAPGDPASASAEWVRLNFDFTGTSFTGLQRLNRITGATEVVALVPNGTNKYYLDLQLDGGTGDIFRFYPQ